MIVALAASGCSSSPQIETFKVQIADLERQVTFLQRESARQESLDEIRDLLAAQLAALDTVQRQAGTDLGRLDERIETLRSELASAMENIESLHAEVAAAHDGLVALEAAMAVTPTPVNVDTQAGADPQDLYQSSYDLFLRGYYTDAIVGFRLFIERFPNSELADNATYWIGESYFSQGAFEEAIQAFGQVGSLYPNSERIASSLLREGSARLELGDRVRGRQALLAVVERYPRSDEAILARQQLDRLPG